MGRDETCPLPFHESRRNGDPFERDRRENWGMVLMLASNAEFMRCFLTEVAAVAEKIDCEAIEVIAERIAAVRESSGRVADVEAYAPTDNPAALTAAANDYGWRESLSRWLTCSRIGKRDMLMVFSVGGGSEDPPVSLNVVDAVRLAADAGAFVCGVVGPDGGNTAQLADICIRVPVRNRSFWTTHTEIFQSVVWHMLVTHPALNRVTPKWESLRA
jgi:D-sedoheptulose 7-phosphate isomerase